jgi:hypothetical protein
MNGKPLSSKEKKRQEKLARKAESARLAAQVAATQVPAEIKPDPNGAPRQQQTADQSSSPETGLSKPNTAEWIMVGITGIYVVVAFFQWCAMSDQLGAMRDQIKQSEESRKLDERAWVGVKSITFKPMVVGKKLGVVVALSNSGKTAAKEVNMAIHMKFTNDPQETIEVTEDYFINHVAHKSMDEALSAGVILPGADYYGGTGIESSDLTQRVIDGVSDGTFKVYVVGQILYYDIFNELHKTDFAYESDPAVGTGLYPVRSKKGYNNIN